MKLLEFKDGDGLPIAINLDKIAYITRLTKSTCIHFIGNDSYTYIDEPYDEVVARIKNAYEL